MRRNSLAAVFLHTFFDRSLEDQAQVFHLMALIGIVTGIGAASLSAAIKDNIYVVVINLAISVISFLLLLIASYKKEYRLCSCVFTILVFFIAFPLLFFACGGYRSGAGHFFLIAILFTSVLLQKYERRIALALEVILYLLCFFFAYRRPESVAILMSESGYIVDNIVNFTITCIILAIVIYVRTRMFQFRQEQIQELNRELLAGNEALARYDRMKSDFLATVAHEINTPLAIIAASSNDTLDLLDESSLDLEEIRENQIVIERRVKLIDSILLDLMDTVAIESGRLSLRRQPLYLAERINDICKVQHMKLDENNNEITFDLQAGLPEIWADPQRVEQVIINLLSNAFRYTQNGTITVKLIRINRMQIVSVIDNGEGMDAETAKTALRQYVSTKADHWRHGIGLYICRRIILAHGGEIWIDSEKGVGTAISFSLKEDSGHVWM